MTTTAAVKLFPIQAETRRRDQACVRESVYMAAYEVYAHVHGPQEAMIDLEGRNCRGGFGLGELTAYLYARSFPKAEWRARTEEAFEGMNLR